MVLGLESHSYPYAQRPPLRARSTMRQNDAVQADAPWLSSSYSNTDIGVTPLRYISTSHGSP